MLMLSATQVYTILTVQLSAFLNLPPRAGYKAAIVHNGDSDDLISMGSNDSDSEPDTDSSQEENEVSEHTPLLRPLASVSTQSFGALSESRSHQNMTESSDYEEDDNEDTDSSDAENEINEHSVVVQPQPNGEQDYNIANIV
ncbi:hypothetical protein J1605_018534 [Eschrichtius robustus]|uniref:Uncharacterized protein n=1 Tax=Eschrichtius robustus TaxID=9764 RepID=A0AB34HV66_ESCRO|nr:hypothetical protein J1605_018534 [Eschrichtius robustus]